MKMDGDLQARDMPHIDNILGQLNPTGRYQWLHIFVVGFGGFGSAFQLFTNVFIAKDVPHLCAGPPEGINWTGVFGEVGNATVIRGVCDLSLDNHTIKETHTCVYGYEYELPIATSAVSQFDLVCERKWFSRVSQTLVFVGQGIGAAVGSMLGDRFGRKTMIVCANLGLLASGILTAYSPNIYVFMLAKLIIGVFQQAEAMNYGTFMSELFPAPKRKIAASCSSFTWGLAVTILALFAFCLKDQTWRTLQMVLSLISLWALFQWWYMDESLRWLVANGKAKQAIKAIKRMARTNKRNNASLLQEIHLSTQPLTDGLDGRKSGDVTLHTGTRQLTFLDILRIPRLLINASCMWFAWFTTALAFFTIYLTATSLSGDPYLNFALTALMEMPVGVFFFLFLNKLGRRRCTMFVFGWLGVCLLLVGIFKKYESVYPSFSILVLLASLASMFGSSACFSIIYSYTPEMFPTNLRSQALGISSSIGRIGAMLAPFAGVLAERAVWAPGLIIGICSCIVCFLMMFLPETTGRELPQTVDELQAWFNDKKENRKELRSEK